MATGAAAASASMVVAAAAVGGAAATMAAAAATGELARMLHECLQSMSTLIIWSVTPGVTSAVQG